MTWSLLAQRLNAGVFSPSPQSEEVEQAKQVLSQNAALFSSPLSSSQQPSFESPPSAAPQGEDNSAVLAQHFEFFQITPETCSKLLRACTPQDKRDLDGFLESLYGHPCLGSSNGAAAGKHSVALALLLNERRALAISLLNLFSQDCEWLHAAKLDLVRANLVEHVCNTAQVLNDHLHKLLSSPAHRGALEFQAQIAHFMWERTTLFKLAFYIACEFGAQLAPSALQALSKLLGAISISPAGIQEQIMTKPIEVLRDWSVLEKSHTLDCISYALFAVLRAMQTYEAEFPQDEPVAIFHDGLEGLAIMAWAFYAHKRSARGEALKQTLRSASAKRALGFLRCLVRSSEFRAQQAALGSPLFSQVCMGLLQDLVVFVADCAAEAEGLGSDMEDPGLMDDENGAGGENAGMLVNAVFPSRATNQDSLEDIIHLVAHVCESGVPASEFACQFVQEGTREHAFLLHCGKTADKAVFYKLLGSLVESECGEQVFAWLRANNFYGETLQLIGKFGTNSSNGSGGRDLYQRLLLLSKLDVFPQHLEYVLPLLALLASDTTSATGNEADNWDVAKTGALVLLTSLCTLSTSTDSVVVHWRRHMYFAGDALQNGEVRFDPVQMHTKSRRSFRLTSALLDFFRALVQCGSNKLDATTTRLVLQFATEVVFCRLDQVQYTFPGERWELCLGCLGLYCMALELPQTSPASMWVQTVFLRESKVFTKLMDVLCRLPAPVWPTTGRKSAAEALQDLVAMSARWPLASLASKRSEWLLAGKRASDFYQYDSNNSGSNHAVGGGSQVAQSFGLMHTNRLVSLFVSEWLQTGEEHPFLFDDGDMDSLCRLHSVKLALGMLQLLKDVPTPPATITEWSPQVQLFTLLLSQSETYITAISSFVGFSLDTECQEMALGIVHYVATHATNPEEQVFIWIQPQLFLRSNTLVFDFLCAHQPRALLRHSVPYLVRVISSCQLTSSTLVEAVRTLSLVPLSEHRTRFSPSALLLRYLDFIQNKYELTNEVLFGLSWTLRLFTTTSANEENGDLPGFPFEAQVLHVAVSSLRTRPIAAQHLIQSWCAFAQRFTVSQMLGLVNMTQHALTDQRSPIPEVVALNLASSALVLFTRWVNTPSSMTNVQASELGLAVVHVLHSMDHHTHGQAFAYELCLLVAVINASPNRLVVHQAVANKAEHVVDVCANICMLQATTTGNQSLQSTAATVFVELFPLVKQSRMELYARRGVFHGMLANASSFSDNNNSGKAILATLEFVAQTREGALALVDHLPITAEFPKQLLRLSLTVSLHDSRFGQRFAEAQKPALLDALKDYSRANWHDAKLVVDLLCKLKPKLAKDEQADDAVSLCLTLAVKRACSPSSFPNEQALIRGCILYLMQDYQSSTVSAARRQSEVDTLCLLLEWLASLPVVDQARNLEQCLVLLLACLSFKWNAKQDFAVLVRLFPKTVGRGETPSPLEQAVATFTANNATLLTRVCQKICDLRFL
ncbi:hypothetical protein BASA81_006833 [Batrachochytrium salamandrivorans]|nr:hypothetical protein BASA81_006833 [Batrachochytrium salamandrivorans]